jgi:antitoxin ParD1/3/4
MSIVLTREQEAWLKAHVERGDFASIEEAACQLLDERIAERIAEEKDDFAWARVHVEEAWAALARGDVIPIDEHKARNVTRLASSKS